VILRFCGVRGSTPAPGVSFVRVGGHTSCVAVWPDGSPSPRLLLDAGTGIRAVDPLVGRGAFHGTILLSHLHWDHVQGLPFFGAGDRDDSVVDLLIPDEGVPASAMLARAMSPPHFPIAPEGLRGTWQFATLGEGWREVEGLAVLAREVPHKGGRTFGYRVEGATGSFAYLPDHLPGGEGTRDGMPSSAARVLSAGADVLVHDAQFVAGESALAAAYGHATVEQAVALAAEAGVGELVLFHHSPERTDDQATALLRAAVEAAPCPVRLAVEGDELTPRRRGVSSVGRSDGHLTDVGATLRVAPRLRQPGRSA
jgi:phosphoribosyl 1,2-cyclic phosphodiesterase